MTTAAVIAAAGARDARTRPAAGDLHLLVLAAGARRPTPDLMRSPPTAVLASPPLPTGDALGLFSANVVTEYGARDLSLTLPASTATISNNGDFPALSR